NTMAEQNVPTQPPTRTDEQIISVDILSDTNFFQAFTASANVPAIYLQQFWNTMKYNKKTWIYSCQVDEQWFDLSADLLRKALAITPVIPAQPFELPPSGNTVIDFVNEPGYLEPVEIVFNIRVNYVYQPWRAILTLINHCLTGKTSGSDKPRHPVLQMLWGIVTQTNVDHAEPLWEEFTQGIQTFFSHKASHKASLKDPKKKVTPLLIPYGRFSKVIIYDLASNNNIHRRPDSRVTSGVSIHVSTQGQAGSDPEKAHEALAGPDPEPMQEDQTGSNSGKAHVSLAGPNPEHMDDEFLAIAYPKVHENLKLITDERVIEDNPESHSGSMSSMKNLDDTDNFGDQFLYDKPTEDDQEKSKVIEESDSTIPDPSHQTVTSNPLQRCLKYQTDHSADVLASIKSQVPTVVDEYLGTKLDDSLLKILERHTADLIEKYSVLPGPESIKNQESEKSTKEIIRIKREQGEEKQDSTYSIRSTDKVDLEEFDLKSALFKHMNKNKSANRNPANYHLYHALMEALIADEDAMDKEVKDRVKNHKRKHDSDNDEDDDDDEGPSAGSNQGKSSKRRRHDSGASGSAQPPTKDDEQSSKKPRESDASASKQHPALTSTSTGWQITDTRDAVVDSSMPRSDTESEHSEQSSDDIPMQDEGHVSDLEDTDNAHIPKVSTTTWFKPIPEGERPATPEPEWTIPPNDFPEPENNWANTYATTYKVPAENKLQRKTYDIGSFIKWFCRRTGKKKLCKADLEGPAFNLVKAFHKNNVFLQYQMDECHKLLTNKVDLSNPEGHQILRNIYEPLPLGGPPGQVTIQPQYQRSIRSEYLLTVDYKNRKTA
ncbi:hypothetical protein Tco_0458430, partial [Tanacetum coccineum]